MRGTIACTCPLFDRMKDGCECAASRPRVDPKARPITLRTAEVRAILGGKKTQLRRLVEPQPACLDNEEVYADLYNKGPNWSFWLPDNRMTEPRTWKSPFGAKGARLWVRETWQAVTFYKDFESGYCDMWDHVERIPEGPSRSFSILYAERDFVDEHREDRGFPWRPPLHMPKWASRLTLEVLNVRVHRLQDVTDDEARAEGMDKFFDRYECFSKEQRITDEYARDEEYRASFACYWDENFGDKALWSKNPWVFAMEFKSITDSSIVRP